MFTNTKSMLNGIILLLALGLAMGCATGPKTPSGGHATAEKGAPISGGNGEGDFTVRTPVEPVPLTDLDPSGEFNLCKRIHFDYDKYDIKAEWAECLNNIARFAKAKPGLTIIIEGHCDERGSDEYNIALGERRANATAEFLIEKGVAAERIITKSWGESKPLATGHSESSWKLNRRADFFGAVDDSR